MTFLMGRCCEHGGVWCYAPDALLVHREEASALANARDIVLSTQRHRCDISAGWREQRGTPGILQRHLLPSPASWPLPLPLLLVLPPILPLLPPPPPDLCRDHHRRPYAPGRGRVLTIAGRGGRCCGCGASETKICRWRRWSGELLVNYFVALQDASLPHVVTKKNRPPRAS